MRKYGKLLLVLAVLAAVPAVASADSGLNKQAPAAEAAQKQKNQLQAEQVKAAMRKAQIKGTDIKSNLSSIQQTAAVVPSNQQVAEQIGGALYKAGLQGYDISIHYQKGIATLSGPVATPAQRAAAENATRQIPGIKQVVNKLEVSQPVAQRAAVPQQPAPQGPPMSRAAYSQQLAPAAYAQQAPPAIAAPSPMMQASASAPMAMGGAGFLSHPHLPAHAWPAYAQYPNSAAVTYPTQYSASAFPYIGPFYPYPQVPLGWRDVRLQWDDGFWHLNFNKEPNVWRTLFSIHGDD